MYKFVRPQSDYHVSTAPIWNFIQPAEAITSGQPKTTRPQKLELARFSRNIVVRDFFHQQQQDHRNHDNFIQPTYVQVYMYITL